MYTWTVCQACQLPQFLHSCSRMPLPKPRPIQPKARPIQPKALPVRAKAINAPSEPAEPPPWVKLGINKPPAAVPVPCLWSFFGLMLSRVGHAHVLKMFLFPIWSHFRILEQVGHANLLKMFLCLGQLEQTSCLL